MKSSGTNGETGKGGRSATARGRVASLILGLGISGLLVAAAGTWWFVRFGSEFLWENRDYFRGDELAGHLHHPGLSRVFDWEEHPKGRVVQRTNNLGFREDEDTSPQKQPGVVRILVTGDSHTDGVVSNDESFPNLLETWLNSKRAGKRTFEVLNGGHGSYGPQNYAGFLRRFLSLEPDVFVVAFYTGNDFLDALAYAEARGEIPESERPEGYWKKLKSLKQVGGGRYAGRSQGINQLYLLKVRPDLEEQALDLSVSSLLEIAEICSAQGIGLIVLLVPTLFDVEWDRDAARNEVMRRTLDLSDDDLGINRRLARRLADRLERAGIPTVDLLEPMEAIGRPPLYWVLDYHLATEGHRIAAETLLAQPLIQRLLNQRADTGAAASQAGPPGA